MPRRAAALFLVGHIACRERTPSRGPDAASDAGVQAADADVLVTAAAPLPLPPPARKLVLKGTTACSVVEEAIGKVVGKATNTDTAAGGSEVTCDGFALDGKVIYFSNSRGTYPKDARLGKTNDRELPCDGEYASDLSSCLKLKLSTYGYNAAEPGDFSKEIELCTATRPQDAKCVSLAVIPRGGNVVASNSPKAWDATYCDDAHVVTVANGILQLFAAPRESCSTKHGCPG